MKEKKSTATVHVLEKEAFIERPLEEVFNFFSRAENLELLTPTSLRFKILTPSPIQMKPGALIEYRLSLFGLPFRWKTLIQDWEPPLRFVDSQLSGPYLSWVHEHTFQEVMGGTRMCDRVEYQVPGGPLEPLIHRLFVGPQVKQIFEFRTATILRLMGQS